MCPEPRAYRASPARWPALAAAAMLSACALQPPAAAPPSPHKGHMPTSAPAPAAAPTDSPPMAPPPAAAASASAAEPAVAMPVQGGLPGAARPDTSSASLAMLAYADRLRRLQPPELTQEVARLSEIQDNARQPGDDLQLALALVQARAPNDLVRAQSLVARVLNNTRDEARSLHPLAGLLASRLADQRRLEDQLDKQTQQVREQQRRIDQLNERLEAVRAIERSLTARPPPPNGAAPRPPN